jgi:cbb3-type cytochrome oxidase subunit 3
MRGPYDVYIALGTLALVLILIGAAAYIVFRRRKK